MSSDREAQVVLITGTRTGIGRHLAEHFLQRGATVVGCSRGEGSLVSDRYLHFPADVRREEDVRGLFSQVRRQCGRLDAVVNNAGMLALAPAVLTAGSTVEALLGTNVAGLFFCCREAVPLMKSRGFGRIVNLTSVAVPLAPAGSSIYSAAKAAVQQLTRVLARELAPFGITVNALGLPPVEATGMSAALPKEAIEETLRSLAVRRMVRLDEVAHAVEFFLDERSAAVTGQTLHLGGP